MTHNDSAAPVAVIGATGQQGGATVEVLLNAGATVRAAVRDPKAHRAVALADRGVELAKVDLGSEDSVRGPLDSVPVAFVRPTWFMENLPSKIDRARGVIRLVLPLAQDASLQMVSVRTIGGGCGRVPAEPTRARIGSRDRR